MELQIQLLVDFLIQDGLKPLQKKEIEFMVDSGFGATVIGAEGVKAVKARQPDQHRNGKLAHGSIIHNKRHLNFKALTQDGQTRSISASMSDVDEPLLSVPQAVAGGSTVVFSPKNNYIDSPGGRSVPFELQGNIYTLKLWVPKNQDAPYQGQA